ncbi:MAG TPA: hypothetical protein VGJ71_10420 [Candidatus Limnocylindrales bacterium]
MILLRRVALTAAAAIVLAFAAIGLARTVASIAPASSAAAPTTIPTTWTASTAAETALSDDIDALLAADKATAAPERAATRGELRRLAAWRKLVHATVVVDLPALGGLTTIQLDHGTVSAVSATSLTISETGGGSTTVDLGAKTKVRRAGSKATIADLKTGDEVFALSRVEADGTEAYLVVVPKA